MNRQQNQVVLPEPLDVGRQLVSAAGSFARSNPIISGSYGIGLLILALLGIASWTNDGTLLPLSRQQLNQYNSIMNSINVEAEFQAQAAYQDAKWRHAQVKHGFLGWSCSTPQCLQAKAHVERTQQVYQAMEREGKARRRDARAVVGLFADPTIQQAQDLFWNYFSSGKRFAQRQTMWDVLFSSIRMMGTRGRDVSWAEYALNIVLQLLINLSLGLVVALVVFCVGLISLVRETPTSNPLVAVVFFILAASAAMAFVVTYLLAVYGATAGSLYGVAKLAETQARQQQARLRQQGGQGRQGQYRAHYD